MEKVCAQGFHDVTSSSKDYCHDADVNLSASNFDTRITNLSDVIMDAILKATAHPIIPGNQLTSARVAVNSFRHSSLRKWAIHHRSEVCDDPSQDFCRSAPEDRLCVPIYASSSESYAQKSCSRSHCPGCFADLGYLLRLLYCVQQECEVGICHSCSEVSWNT